MSFLPKGIVGYQCDYESHSTYTILKEDRIDNDGFLCGPGIQIEVIHPDVKYRYHWEYSIGDDGWERLFKSGYFFHDYGKSNGSGIENDQLILFNMYEKFSIWTNFHSHIEYRKFVPAIIGLTYLDMMYRFNSKTVVDTSISESARPLIDAFHKTELSPRPKFIKKNDIDKKFDYSKYEAKVDTRVAKVIPDHFVFFGHMGFKYEMSRLSKYPIDLISPRWWKLGKEKIIDSVENIYDNQIPLF